MLNKAVFFIFAPLLSFLVCIFFFLAHLFSSCEDLSEDIFWFLKQRAYPDEK